MARQGKTINVKVPRTKVVKALENKLIQIQKDKANQKVNEEKFLKAQEKYNKEVGKLALAHISKATDLNANVRYSGQINVDFYLPAGTITLPDEPKKDFDTYNEWQYKEMVEEIENAIRVLKMCEDEYINTGTYGNISQYL